MNLLGALSIKQAGRDVEILANGSGELLLNQLKSHPVEDLKVESLSLEEIFVASDLLKKAKG